MEPGAALMISISGGPIVTRASPDGEMGADSRKQAFGTLAAMALVPGLPEVSSLIPGGCSRPPAEPRARDGNSSRCKEGR